MKILLSESQYKSLTQEIQTKEKDKVGKGVWHIVYPSKKYPDKVYKIGSPSTVVSWINQFKENPNIFPNVYHVGKGEYNGKKYMYVLLEKLNTKKLENLWRLLDDISYEITSDDFDDVVIKYTYEHHEKMDKVLDFIQEKLPDIYDNTIELVKLIDDVMKIEKHPDLHMGQFGYDKNGKLKCLDI